MHNGLYAFPIPGCMQHWLQDIGKAPRSLTSLQSTLEPGKTPLPEHDPGHIMGSVGRIHTSAFGASLALQLHFWIWSRREAWVLPACVSGKRPPQDDNQIRRRQRKRRRCSGASSRRRARPAHGRWRSRGRLGSRAWGRWSQTPPPSSSSRGCAGPPPPPCRASHNSC